MAISCTVYDCDAIYKRNAIFVKSNLNKLIINDIGKQKLSQITKWRMLILIIKPSFIEYEVNLIQHICILKELEKEFFWERGGNRDPSFIACFVQ